MAKTEAALQARRGLHQREDNGTHQGKFLCGQIPELFQRAAAGQSDKGKRHVKGRQENRRIAWAVSPLLLQAWHPAKEETAELRKASLSSERRLAEDGFHYQRNKAALPQPHRQGGALLSYKGSLESEMQELTEQRKGLYSQSRKSVGEEKETVKARLSEITERMKIIRKEVRFCDGVFARSDIIKEKLQTIRADEKEQQRKELMKHEHRRRSGGANRKDELGGI